MARPKPLKPKLCHETRTGRAYRFIDGRRHPLARPPWRAGRMGYARPARRWVDRPWVLGPRGDCQCRHRTVRPHRHDARGLLWSHAQTTHARIGQSSPANGPTSNSAGVGNAPSGRPAPSRTTSGDASAWNSRLRAGDPGSTARTPLVGEVLEPGHAPVDRRQRLDQRGREVRRGEVRRAAGHLQHQVAPAVGRHAAAGGRHLLRQEGRRGGRRARRRTGRADPLPVRAGAGEPHEFAPIGTHGCVPSACVLWNSRACRTG